MTLSPPITGRPVVMITGYRGLAESLIKHFIQNGYQLSVLVRNESLLSSLRNTYPTVLFEAGDLHHRNACLSWIKKTHQIYSRIDGLINNAAITGPGGKLTDYSFDEFEEAFQINFLSPLFLCQQIIPYLAKSACGVVINLSGGGATGPRPHFSAYGASKTALVRMTENLALEYPDLRFYSIAPGALKTPMMEKVAALSRDAIGKESDDAKKCLDKGGEDPKKAAELALWLFQERPKHLSGRLISAIWDKYKETPSSLGVTDLWTLRRVDEVLLKRLKDNV